MAEFWLATWRLQQGGLKAGSRGEPLLGQGKDKLAIEVMREAGEIGVLFSWVDDVDAPAELRCRIGFTNGARTANAWRDRGFPLVDAIITLDAQGKLQVRSPFFDGNPGSMKYDALLVEIDGVAFASKKNSPGAVPAYVQREQAPDPAAPATSIRSREVRWSPIRYDVASAQGVNLQLNVQAARSPSLSPLANAAYVGVRSWSGVVDLAVEPRREGEVVCESRVDAFGVPAFRFRDLEAVGFRIDLPRGDPNVQALLAELLRPLNFHLETPEAAVMPDFRFEPATHSLLIELLHYGRMQLREQLDPLTITDYQSQHELVVRILVGRADVEGDIRDAAAYVPSIFVNNPWSKIVGRDLQGFGKCLADFCVGEPGAYQRLLPDGRSVDATGVPAANPEGLSAVRCVCLVRESGNDVPGATPLLDIRYDRLDDPAADAFKPMGPGDAIAGFSLSDVRWRAADFDDLLCTGEFLRGALGQVLHGFRSVQASPVGDQDLESTWITGKFAIEDVVQVSFPLGTARLRFHQVPDAPPGWNTVCKLVGSRPWHDMHVGGWYRLRFAMDMTVDDGLDWTD